MTRAIVVRKNAQNVIVAGGPRVITIKDTALWSSFLAQAKSYGLLAVQAGSAQVHVSWSGLSGVTGSPGDAAIIFEDAGTHTDPVVGGTVENAGIYQWSTSPAGWERVADTEAARADAFAAQAAGYAAEARTGAETALGLAEDAQEGAEAAKAGAETARDQAIAAGAAQNIYPLAARDDVPRGATGTGAITPGSSGTDGTFDLAFTGGNFDVDPMGTFTVESGAVTAITITGPGLYIGDSPTAPTLDFSASANLAGADATLTVGFLVPAGNYYYAPSEDDGYVSQFQNVGGVATLVEEHFDPLSVGAAKTYAETATAATATIAQPSILPDPFFQLSSADTTAKFEGLPLLSQPINMDNRSWDADYEHPYGRGAWLYDSGSADLMGFNLFWDWTGLVEGDVFSLAVAVVASAGQVNFKQRQFDAYTPAYNFGSHSTTGPSAVTMDGTVKVIKIENIAVEASSIGSTIQVYDGSASNFHVLAVWAVKGASIASTPPPRLSPAMQERLIADQSRDELAPEIGKTNWAIMYQPEWSDAELVGSDLTGVVFTARTYNFCGFGDVIDPPTDPINALQVSVRQGTGGAGSGATTVRPWSKVGVIVKTGASGTAHQAGATVLAMGTAEVEADTTSYDDLVIPLRDPTSGELLTEGIDPGDYSDEVLHLVYGIQADGTPASIDQPNGTRSDRVGTPRSYYYLYSAVMPGQAGAALFGNPGIGIKHLFLDDLAEGFAPTPALAEKLGGGDGGGGFEPQAERCSLMRRLRTFAFRRAQGDTGIRHHHALIGDSWTAASSYGSAPLARALVDRFGDGGVGFFGFGFWSSSYNSVAADARGLYAMTRTAGWTSNYHAGSTSPNISDARSSTATDKLTIASVTGATHPALSAVKLYFEGTADGVIRWRWNAGSWSSDTDVQGTVGDQQQLDLTGFPTGALNSASAGTITLEIEVVSGSVILCGMDMQSASDGIVVHKLGATGATSAQWATAAVDDQWQAAIAALGIQSANIHLGINDQAGGTPAGTYASHMETIAEGVRVAVPGCDLMMVAPPETPFTPARSPAMPAMQAALRAKAAAFPAAYLNFQDSFGSADNRGEYADGGDVPLFGSDDTHPNSDGARRVAATLEQALLAW